MDKPQNPRRQQRGYEGDDLTHITHNKHLSDAEKRAMLELSFSEKINRDEMKRVLSAINWLHEIFTDGEAIKIDAVDFTDFDTN